MLNLHFGKRTKAKATVAQVIAALDCLDCANSFEGTRATDIAAHLNCCTDSVLIAAWSAEQRGMLTVQTWAGVEFISFAEL